MLVYPFLDCVAATKTTAPITNTHIRRFIATAARAQSLAKFLTVLSCGKDEQLKGGSRDLG
jgi:hypothetical protein